MKQRWRPDPRVWQPVEDAEPVAAEAQRCMNCNHHVVNYNVDTRLCEFVGDPAHGGDGLCGCRCEFPAPQVEGAETYSIMLARKIVDYLAGTYIDPEIALMEVLPIAEIIDAAALQSTHTPADEEVAREIVEDELDEMMSPREFAATKAALVKRITTALNEARRAQGTCTWSLIAEHGGPHDYYRSECGIMASRRQKWWKYCSLCGKPLAEAGREEGEGNG